MSRDTARVYSRVLSRFVEYLCVYAVYTIIFILATMATIADVCDAFNTSWMVCAHARSNGCREMVCTPMYQAVRVLCPRDVMDILLVAMQIVAMASQPAYYACRYFLLWAVVYIFQPGIKLDRQAHCFHNRDEVLVIDIYMRGQSFAKNGSSRLSSVDPCDRAEHRKQH